MVPVEAMVDRIGAAVAARRDPDFVICAHTDARAIERAEAYAEAGADMVFPEALAGAEELRAVRRRLRVPILANMTEFGKTELLDRATLEEIGVNVVIYPVTLLRLAMGAAERGLRALVETGTQRSEVGAMMTRARLYELIDYDGYTRFEAAGLPGATDHGER